MENKYTDLPTLDSDVEDTEDIWKWVKVNSKIYQFYIGTSGWLSAQRIGYAEVHIMGKRHILFYEHGCLTWW